MSSEFSTQYPPSTRLFEEWVNRVPEIVRETIDMLSPGALEAAAVLLNNARRIFCVGSGSSVATAWHLAMSLCSHGGMASSYATTSQLVSMESLGAGDLIVLVSQGFNRSDSAIVVHTAHTRGASLVVITANPTPKTADAVLYFLPRAEEERLFCRPCGGISSLVVGELLLAACLKKSISVGDIVRAADTGSLPAWRSGHSLRKVSELIDRASLVIVLGSGDLQPALHHLALSLREGAGKVAEFYEIEYYAHGQYAPHFRHQDAGGMVVYLLAEASEDRVSSRSLERILPLLASTNSTYEIASFAGPVSLALVSLLAASNHLVHQVILRNEYDMNHPRGKEENRGFQLVSEKYYE